ncbi:MAG: type II secretion system secretin GspD [Desulfobia sp.]
MFRIFLIVNLLLVFCSVSAASTSKTVSFNFRDADIRSVIKSVAKFTGKTIVIDPKVKGKVDIVSSQPMEAKKAYDVFLSILQVHHYTAIEAGNVLKIVPYHEAKQDMAAEDYSEQIDDLPTDSVVTRIYKLEHVSANNMVKILKPLVTKHSYLSANQESNSIIISDRAGNVKRLLRIIKQLDQEITGEIEVIRLEHADAREIVAVIDDLESRRKTTGEQLRMAADTRTNSILLSGDEQHLLRAKALVSHLDNPVANQGRTQVIFLRHAKAEDLVPILRGLELPDDQKSDRVTSAKKRSDISIGTHENTNALIITAPPTAMHSFQVIIRELDIRRTQLMVKAVIAEVSTDKGAELGVQWSSTDTVESGESGVIGGTTFSGTNPGIYQFNEDQAGAALSSMSGLNLGYFDGTTTILGTEILNLGALISALSTDSDTNILSTPSLVTLDNQEAEIVVGQNVPYITGSYTTDSSDSSVNPFQTIEREDVGLKLKIKPQINEGNIIQLDIEQEVSNIESYRDEGPTTNTRSITTSVVVENGKILVLGGLISDELQESVQKVPLLGDIPLLGQLFRYTSSQQQKRNLMVFLQPIILRDSSMSSKISMNKYDAIRNLQLDRAAKGIPLMPDARQPVLPENGMSMEMDEFQIEEKDILDPLPQSHD